MIFDITDLKQIDDNIRSCGTVCCIYTDMKQWDNTAMKIINLAQWNIGSSHESRHAHDFLMATLYTNIDMSFSNIIYFAIPSITQIGWYQSYSYNDVIFRHKITNISLFNNRQIYLFIKLKFLDKRDINNV